MEELPSFYDKREMKLKHYTEKLMELIDWDDADMKAFEKKWKIKNKTWADIKGKTKLWKALDFGKGDSFLNEGYRFEDYFPDWELAVCEKGFDTGMCPSNMCFFTLITVHLT